MPTVFSEEGFQIVIRTDDHPPAHVHVLKSGANYRLFLTARRAPERVYGRMTIRDLARAVAIVARERKALQKEWRKYHK
jgi:hypothetical protein